MCRHVSCQYTDPDGALYHSSRDNEELCHLSVQCSRLGTQDIHPALAKDYEDNLNAGHDRRAAHRTLCQDVCNVQDRSFDVHIQGIAQSTEWFRTITKLDQIRYPHFLAAITLASLSNQMVERATSGE